MLLVHMLKILVQVETNLSAKETLQGLKGCLNHWFTGLDLVLAVVVYMKTR